MKDPTEAELVEAISDAARNAVSELFRKYPEHHFYYCSLITTGEAHPPVLVAWSEEALIAKAAELGYEGDGLLDLKWSYADSPFYCYGDQYFDRVRQLFETRPRLDFDAPGQWQAEYALRLRAMEAAMARLDKEGVFGSGNERLGIVINAEVMPPDHTNVERALRLNSRQALREWLVEAAEPAPSGAK